MKHLASQSRKTYQLLIKDIGSILDAARQNTYHVVNEIMVQTYWEIGKRIVSYEQGGKVRARYGERLLERIAADLQGRRGFSVDNLERMRAFFSLFPKSETASRKLSWSHYCLLMRVKDHRARRFYLIETEREGWSVRNLDRQ